MKTLTLVRHAKSSWSDPGAGDHQRTLNDRGLRDAPVMGQRLARQIQPDTILCSDATRAQQTADLLLPAMGLDTSDIQIEPRIYEASTRTLLDTIAEQPSDAQSLMLIGHNPGMERLCNTLLSGSVQRMVTCAVSSYEIDTDSWSDLTNRPTRLLVFDFPKNPQ